MEHVHAIPVLERDTTCTSSLCPATTISESGGRSSARCRQRPLSVARAHSQYFSLDQRGLRSFFFVFRPTGSQCDRRSGAEILRLPVRCVRFAEVLVVDPSATQFTNRRLYLLFGWLGLLTGVVEAVRSWVWDRYLTGSLFRNDHAIWMTPLAECLVFLLVGTALWCFTCCLTRPRRVTVVVVGLAMLSSLSVAWGYLYLWAILMLGCGLATCLVRAVREQPDRILAGMRWTTPGLLLFVGDWGAGANGPLGRRRTDRRAAACRPTPRTSC